MREGAGEGRGMGGKGRWGERKRRKQRNFLSVVHYSDAPYGLVGVRPELEIGNFIYSSNTSGKNTAA